MDHRPSLASLATRTQPTPSESCCGRVLADSQAVHILLVHLLSCGSGKPLWSLLNLPPFWVASPWPCQTRELAKKSQALVVVPTMKQTSARRASGYVLVEGRLPAGQLRTRNTCETLCASLMLSAGLGMLLHLCALCWLHDGTIVDLASVDGIVHRPAGSPQEQPEFKVGLQFEPRIACGATHMLRETRLNYRNTMGLHQATM